jgi:hypothetical protein
MAAYFRNILYNSVAFNESRFLPGSGPQLTQAPDGGLVNKWEISDFHWGWIKLNRLRQCDVSLNFLLNTRDLVSGSTLTGGSSLFCVSLIPDNKILIWTIFVLCSQAQELCDMFRTEGLWNSAVIVCSQYCVAGAYILLNYAACLGLLIH